MLEYKTRLAEVQRRFLVDKRVVTKNSIPRGDNSTIEKNLTLDLKRVTVMHDLTIVPWRQWSGGLIEGNRLRPLAGHRGDVKAKPSHF